MGVRTMDAVGRRTRELGLRIAMGAEPARVRRMVLRQGMIVALIGVGIGGALGATRLMRAVLFGVSPADPLTHGVTVAVVVGVALMATWVPAKRAARGDPMEALRAE
jgi:putative ABC transport system permease protein